MYCTLMRARSRKCASATLPAGCPPSTAASAKTATAHSGACALACSVHSGVEDWVERRGCAGVGYTASSVVGGYGTHMSVVDEPVASTDLQRRSRQQYAARLRFLSENVDLRRQWRDSSTGDGHCLAALFPIQLRFSALWAWNRGERRRSTRTFKERRSQHMHNVRVWDCAVLLP